MRIIASPYYSQNSITNIDTINNHTWNSLLTVPRLECNSAPTPQDSTIRFTLTLVHTGGLNLTNHTVEVQPINSENFTTVDQEVFVSIVNSQITDFVINNTFEAGSTFTFRVSSSNSLGFSDPVECPPLNLTIGKPHGQKSLTYVATLVCPVVTVLPYMDTYMYVCLRLEAQWSVATYVCLQF